MIKDKQKRRAGMTLLEVALAILIVSIAFSGIIMSIGNSRKNLVIARIQRIAAEVADGRLEFYNTYPPASDGSVTEKITVGNYSFNVTTTFENKSRSEDKVSYDYYEVQVTVNQMRLPRPVVLKTEIRDRTSS